MKSILKILIVVSAVVLMICPISCNVSEHGLVLLDTITEDSFCSPQLQSYTVTGDKSIRLVFNEKINLMDYGITPAMSVSDINVDNSNNGGAAFYDIILNENMNIGEQYKLYGVVEDKIGNTLTFSIPFTGYNNQVPDLQISEVHPKYSSSKTAAGTTYRCEFIEIVARSNGNLSGVKICSANDGEGKEFILPAVQVKENDIIIVHLRNKTFALSELDEKTDSSISRYSSSNARDLWNENDSARLGDEMDIITIENPFNGKIIDALCYGNSKYENWKTDFIKAMAEKVVNAGLWESSDYSKSVKSDEITPTKSIIRIGTGHSASDWKISKTNGETPGIIEY